MKVHDLVCFHEEVRTSYTSAEQRRMSSVAELGKSELELVIHPRCQNSPQPDALGAYSRRNGWLHVLFLQATLPTSTLAIRSPLYNHHEEEFFQEDRSDILRVHLRSVKHSSDVNPDQWAARTDGWTGADLKALITNAQFDALRGRPISKFQDPLRSGRLLVSSSFFFFLLQVSKSRLL